MYFKKPNRDKKIDKRYKNKCMRKYNPTKEDGKLRAIQAQLKKRKKIKEEQNED